MIKVYSMTAIMDLSFPGQQTATATSCIHHDSVYTRGLRARKSENGFFRCDTRLQIFLNDSKICEAEVTVTPLINKICKPCRHYNIHYQKSKKLFPLGPWKSGDIILWGLEIRNWKWLCVLAFGPQYRRDRAENIKLAVITQVTFNSLFTVTYH